MDFAFGLSTDNETSRREELDSIFRTPNHVQGCVITPAASRYFLSCFLEQRYEDLEMWQKLKPTTDEDQKIKETAILRSTTFVKSFKLAMAFFPTESREDPTPQATGTSPKERTNRARDTSIPRSSQIKPIDPGAMSQRPIKEQQSTCSNLNEMTIAGENVSKGKADASSVKTPTGTEHSATEFPIRKENAPLVQQPDSMETVYYQIRNTNVTLKYWNLEDLQTEMNLCAQDYFKDKQDIFFNIEEVMKYRVRMIVRTSLAKRLGQNRIMLVTRSFEEWEMVHPQSAYPKKQVILKGWNSSRRKEDLVNALLMYNPRTTTLDKEGVDHGIVHFEVVLSCKRPRGERSLVQNNIELLLTVEDDVFNWLMQLKVVAFEDQDKCPVEAFSPAKHMCEKCGGLTFHRTQQCARIDSDIWRSDPRAKRVQERRRLAGKAAFSKYTELT